MQAEIMVKTVNKGVTGIVDRFQGDKVVLVIVLLLMGISILAIFGSTSQLAASNSTSRVEIVSDHLKTVGLGLIAMIAFYSIRSITFFRIMSQAGFIASVLMLVTMYATIGMKGPVHGDYMNGEAIRYLYFFGINIQVFEFVKVLMIFYMSWAISSYKNGLFKITKHVATMDRMDWIDTPLAQRVIYFYIPFVTVTLLVMKGGNSSAVIIAGIMFMTMLLGGMPVKNILGFGALGVVGIGLLVGVSMGTDGAVFPRLKTAVGRLERSAMDDEYILSLPRRSKEYNDLKDKMQQPMGAKLAVGGAKVFGKGFGKSTQKYNVPVMYEDYMFSYIVEETGIWGALVLIILYCTLLARGSLIVRGLKNTFAKAAVTGTVLLITGQAFLHMFVNVDIGPLTGQTLPMISHGRTSFLLFSMAFGILLSFSREAKANSDLADEDIRKSSEVIQEAEVYTQTEVNTETIS